MDQAPQIPQTPMEKGAAHAVRAVIAVQRAGFTREEAIDHFLGNEGHGIQGALNAAINTYGKDAPAEKKILYALGWTSALLHLKLES